MNNFLLWFLTTAQSQFINLICLFKRKRLACRVSMLADICQDVFEMKVVVIDPVTVTQHVHNLHTKSLTVNHLLHIHLTLELNPSAPAGSICPATEVTCSRLKKQIEGFLQDVWTWRVCVNIWATNTSSKTLHSYFTSSLVQLVNKLRASSHVTSDPLTRSPQQLDSCECVSAPRSAVLFETGAWWETSLLPRHSDETEADVSDSAADDQHGELALQFYLCRRRRAAHRHYVTLQMI